jgi:hypothetical protein
MKNFRNISLQVIFCFLLFTSAAQPRPGIKAGLNYAGLSGYSGDKLLSFHAGIFLHVSINKNWRFQPELLYSGEGQHYLVYDNSENPAAIENTITLKYVQLPIVVQYFPTPSLYVEGGPQIAVLAAAYSKGMGDDHLNLKRSFGNTQFGLILGAGYLFNQRFGIYGRYYFGLTEVTPFNSDANRSHTAQFGISFRINKGNTAASKDKDR